jgi:hypothetical protein
VEMIESPLFIEGRYAMTDTNVFQLSQPGSFAEPVTKVLRVGARTLLAHLAFALLQRIFCFVALIVGSTGVPTIRFVICIFFKMMGIIRR